MRAWAFVLLALLAVAPVARAADDASAYVVAGVTVSLSKTEGAARDQAVRLATKEGFGQLLKNLTPQDTWPRHADILQRADMNLVLQSFKVVSETTAPYTLTLDLTYNRDVVRSLLGAAQVPFAEVSGGPMLVVPLMDMPNGRVLWEEINPWRDFLQQAAGKATGLRLILPTGDVKEMTTLTPEMAALGAGDAVMAIAHAYDAPSAVVARLRTDGEGDQRRLVVDLQWFGQTPQAPTTLDVPFTNDQPFDEGLRLAATTVAETLAATWRDKNLVDFNRPGHLMTLFQLQKLADLRTLTDRLGKIAIVQNVWVRALSRKEAYVQLDFLGSNDKLVQLAQDNRLLLIPGTDYWYIGLAENPPPATAPAPTPQAETWTDPTDPFANGAEPGTAFDTTPPAESAPSPDNIVPPFSTPDAPTASAPTPADPAPLSPATPDFPPAPMADPTPTEVPPSPGFNSLADPVPTELPPTVFPEDNPTP